MEIFFKEKQIKLTPFFPVTNATIERKEENKSLIDRNFNITWIDSLPEQNEILDGEWFSEDMENGLSVSDDIAERYDLNIGDEVYLKINEELIETYIQSTRTVNWDSFSPNFFVIGHPALFENITSNYITSFIYLQKNNRWLPN